MKLSAKQEMKNLLNSIRVDTSCERINPPLVNHFAIHSKIPNRWFDWENRIHSPVMIIGQDWGPYIHLRKYIDDPTQDHFASSRTEKFIINTLNSIDTTLIDSIFFTVAVIFTRTGTLFRGSQNYNEAKSFDISFPYVSRQINIVRPKIILTLGGLAFKTIDQHFRLNAGSQKLNKIVSAGEFQIGDTVIIPAYHPAAFVSPQIQLKSWKKLGFYYSKLLPK
jgi:hypothetical protein